MPVYIEQAGGTAFLAFEGMEDFLLSELSERFNYNSSPERYGRLFYFKDYPQGLPEPWFAQCVMQKPFFLNFESIGQAAAELKKIQRNWAPCSYQFFRRAELIQQKLPYINLKDRTFPVQIPQSLMGLYCLTGQNQILASAQTSSPLPAGKLSFVEDHVNPPSRAYLKIQESLTLFNLFFGAELPKAGQKCFEAGACPGGWTWVFAGLGANVLAVDRSPLDDRLMNNPLVTFQAHDAFTLAPEDIGACDWVFSDVICYPDRLYEWVQKWLKSGLCKNMICTIKMQGGIDWAAAQKFADIPNSRVVHLNYNKHELTWIHCGA
jgi:23S rRNA (cytidine2498-2'-O)-methyltransferase